MKNNKKYISTFFCSGFGIGYFPFFPGTLASLVILPVCWSIKSNFSNQIFLLIIFLYILASLYFLKFILTNKKNMDPKYVVCDEYIGQAIALIFCNQNILDYVIAFLIFRILDIIKPFPISYFDNMKNISGVILDDFFAGFFVSLMFLSYYGM